MADKDITDTMMGAMLYAVAFAAAVVGLAPVFQRILASTPMARHLQAQAYQGLTDARTLNVTPTMQWLNLVSDPPYVGWISASLFNDGPHSAFISINNPNEFLELTPNEAYDINMAGADRRIELIFYKANPGENASVRVIGKY